ncbi:MAG: TIGR00725 family protein [Oscillochloridaceae bacterium]|nr:TIGR00725 family protein [Chloroflexaceae bacterium]MDW8389243.1 TIGR00725 family protein [Oscillochloridaceae bacterium]
MPRAPRAPVIAVCGSGVENERLNTLAEVVGELIARRGAVLVCGGLGGVMAAACRGAARAGGLTVGILPQADPDAANPYVTLAIATGMGQARNVVLVQSADAVIAIGGEYGTLSEIALARKMGRPVVGLMTWDLGASHLHTVAGPEEAVEHALRLAAEARDARRRPGSPSLAHES